MPAITEFASTFTQAPDGAGSAADPMIVRSEDGVTSMMIRVPRATLERESGHAEKAGAPVPRLRREIGGRYLFVGQ